MTLPLSVIIPVLNEADNIAALLARAYALQAQGAEVVMVDGGSSDGSLDLLRSANVTALQSRRGRGHQLRVGTLAAKHDLLLLLHADTRLPDQALTMIFRTLHATSKPWGRFDVRITGRSAWLPLIAWMINQRSRLTGIATGDQAMFMTRHALEAIGGIPDQPLMEDVELSHRLRRLSRPHCLRACVETSGRRWDRHGAWKTIWLMWRLRWLYWRGIPPEQLAEMYQ